MKTPQEEFIKYIESKHEDVKVDRSSIGMIHSGVFVALGSHLVDQEPMEVIIFANMNKPKQSFLFYSGMTLAYWIAGNILWKFPNSIKFAIREGESHGIYRKPLDTKEEENG